MLCTRSDRPRGVLVGPLGNGVMTWAASKAKGNGDFYFFLSVKDSILGCGP